MGPESEKTGLTNIPFRYTGEYTRYEKERLYGFFNSDFPHTTVKSRGMKFIIENPPVGVCDSEEWKRYLRGVLTPEIAVLHPDFRKTPTIVRFVESQKDEVSGIFVGGTGETIFGKHLVRVVLKFDSGEILVPAELIFNMMHEICEHDFWLKTKDGDDEAHEAGGQTDLKLLDENCLAYNNFLDEKIANRRALRAVNRVWPGITLNHEYHEYEEDSPQTVDTLLN